MKVIKHDHDLAKAFERLKKALIETENDIRKPSDSLYDVGHKYASAYGKLCGAVQCHICLNTDTSFESMEQAFKSHQNDSDDVAANAPTLLLQQTTWSENTEWPDINK